MKIKLQILLLLAFLSTLNLAQNNDYYYHQAKGVFLTLGVGPRFPIGEFSNKSNFGPGVEAIISYTDIDFLPIFFYTNFGFQNHAGNFKYYQNSDHASLSTSLITVDLGGKYFFPPISKTVVLLMPFIEGGLSYAYVSNFHQYKQYLLRNDYLENVHKLGFHVGAGLSFFLMEIMASYKYLPNNQSIALNLRVTMPVAISF